MHRNNAHARGGSRPPSAAPPSNSSNNLKRKERDFDQDTSDETNINVVVRCRGRNDREVRENSGVVLLTTGVKGKTVELSMGPNAVSNKTYQFDKVFSPAADQAIIFEDVVSPILSEMLTGYNCTIFAYGQTGTGKTYTMSGDMTESCGLLTDAAGIIPRVLQSLFQKLEADETDCTVKCSFIELYNEDLRDLLAADDSVKLKIYDDANKKGHSATMVQGMEESHITSAAEGIKKLQLGSHRRQVAATKCNDLSSRSHTVFTITTYTKKTSDSNEDYVCSGKLNLVDLAGSENIQRSGAENKRAAEAGLINKSLLTLGRVINALVDKSAHIPYRESKLTRLLQDSLGGRTKTCIIATVSPARSNLEETISTLDYAFRAKNIRNKPQVNSMMSKKTLLKEFTMEIEKLKSELIATRQRNGVYLANEKYEEMIVESESRRILSEEQKARIETMEASLRNKVNELFSLTNNFTTVKKDNEATKLALESTKDVLQKTEIVLAHTKEDLGEESRLRQKYAMTEQKLHHVGNELLFTIDTSLRDVEGLHAKLRRRSALHAQNQQRWEQARANGNTALRHIESNLEELEQDHSMALEAASDRIQSFVAAELERTKQTQSLLDEGLASLSATVEATKISTAQARDNMNEVVEGIKVLRDDVKAQVGQGLNGLSDAAARISGEVISELDQFHAQLHTSYSSLGKDIKAAFDDLTKQLAAQREESDRLRAALQEANRKNVNASLSTASSLQSAIEAEKQAAVDERAWLMQQISELAAKSDDRREARLNAALTASQTGLVEAIERFEAADKEYTAGMNQWNERDNTIREKVAKSKDDIKARFKKDWAAVSDHNNKIQQSTKAVHEETVKIVEAQVQDMATQMTALDDFVARARQQNNDHHQQHLISLEQMSAQLGDQFAKVQSRLSTASTETFHAGIKAHLDEIASTFADVRDKAREPLHQLQKDLIGSEIANYIPTGQTPEKREWTYPRDLPRTIPLPASTTPAGKPPTASSFSRTPGRSPRKQASPRKSPKKQIVRADTPPSDLDVLLPLVEEAALETGGPQSPPSQLKELDANIPTTATAVLHSSSDDDTTKSSVVTTTTTRLPTKPPAPSRSHSVTSTAERLEKENLPGLRTIAAAKEAGSVVPVPAASSSEKLGGGHGPKKNEKLSKSFHMPRMTRSSAAAVKRGTVDVERLGRSMSS